MAMYVPRTLTPRILAPAGAPVSIVEGARAVGKTRLMTEEIAPALGTRVVSLADQATRSLAESDLQSWLESLPRPCVIDEAQLIPDLPLALKAVVDKRGPGLQFVLTGSASINRTGLGGADPLTRRAVRFTLHPLTLWERNRLPGNLVDLLFNAELNPNHEASWSETDLQQHLRLGGFPAYALSPNTSGQPQHARVWEDIQGTLGQRLLPDTPYDATTALKILSAILTHPGRRFNAEKFGRLADVDRRTVTRYIDIFERLFATYHLPNLGARLDDRGVSRSKVHPVDVAFAHAALHQSAVDLSASRDVVGQLVESLVAQEIRAHTSTAEAYPELFFWAAPKPEREVDLVIVAADGRKVGIECKLGRSLRADDAKGLRALDDKLGLHRGFVIHNGSHITRLGDKLWAIPLAILGDANFFQDNTKATSPNRQTSTTTTTTTTMSPPAAAVRVLVNYHRDDDEHDSGRPVQFVRDVVSEFEAISGQTAECILDQASMRLGKDWGKRLGDAITQNLVMMTLVTPRFLGSDECRNEALSFAKATEIDGRPDMLLPVMWIDVMRLTARYSDDPVSSTFQDRQYFDATSARITDRDSSEYRRVVSDAALRLLNTLDASDGHAHQTSTNVHTDNNPTDGDELAELVQRFQSSTASLLEGPLSEFLSSFEAVGDDVSSLPDLHQADTRQMNMALEHFAANANERVDVLKQATSSLRKEWTSLDAATTTVLATARDVASSQILQNVRETLAHCEQALRWPGLTQIVHNMHILGAHPRQLGLINQTTDEALRLLHAMQTSARTWRELAEGSYEDALARERAQ